MSATTTSGQDFVSFSVGGLLLGVPIDRIREISRNVDPTPVPHSPRHVLGVVNLRGELVTVIDLEVVLRGARAADSTSHECVIVSDGAHKIALCVDRVGDVVYGWDRRIEKVPSNLRASHVAYYEGVMQLEDELLVILDLEGVLSAMREGGSPHEAAPSDA